MIFENINEIEALCDPDHPEKIEAMREGKAQRARARVPFVRSALMVSAHKVRHLNKLDELDCDIAIVNLEDGVAPRYKPLALRLAGLFLSRAESLRCKTVVRINPLDEGGAEEIAYLNSVKPDAVRIPKIASPEDVRRALALVDEDIAVHLSVETAGAWRALEALRVDVRVEAAYLGILDLLADMGLPQRLVTPGNPTTTAILTRFLLACVGSGLLPVSFVYQDYKKLDLFEAWCRIEREMGYHAKGCVSPDQVKIANRIFSPESEAIERAEKIVALFESDPDNSGFADEELGFVDEPIYKDARNLLKLVGR